MSELPSLNRRDFMKKSAIGAGLMTLPSFVAGQSPTKRAPNSRLNIALVGVGGKGRGPTIESAENENVVALCDVYWGLVDQQRSSGRGSEAFDAAMTQLEKKGVRKYSDYRVMFEEMGDQIDAVIISIPDHMHFPVALSALNLGIHVYCEKPLTHTVEESRVLAEVAAKKGLTTQMGNQGHSMDGTRLVHEWINAGVIGPIREVHSWTNRPAVYWPQGLGKPDHSKMIPVKPDSFEWDLWLGVADWRAYDPAYAPFVWRAYLDFGCGALGDMACHIMDSAYWGLDLGFPTSIEATCTTLTGYTYPVSSVVTYEFPARGKFPALTYKWYDGDLRPAIPNFLKDRNPLTGQYHANGTMMIGDDAIILTDTYSSTARILPYERFQELRTDLPDPSLRRIEGSHLAEFYSAIRENRPASSDFSYSGPFTEMVLLGTVAQQTGRRLEFDAKKRKFVNDKDATDLLSKQYPEGWILS